MNRGGFMIFLMKTTSKPNILHLFTDMQRFDTIAAMGNPIIKTPNLDRLVNEGIAFTNAFSPSPVCIAARCSMITGQYPMNTGCYENSIMPRDGRATFMEELTKQGYRTHGIGKCHFVPGKFDLWGFQSREVQEEGGEVPNNLEKHHYLNYLKNHGYDHICEAYGVRGEMYYTPQPSQFPAKDHPTAWIGDRSTAFIRENGDAPWYLFSSFIHPHPPLTPPNPWHKLYRAADMPLPNLPENPEEFQTFVNKIQNRYKYGDAGKDRHSLRQMKAYYYACISFVDYQIGRILEALEETKQLDNTLILFSSDHGEYLGDYDSFGKRSMHDSSVRVPMVLRLPGRFAGGKSCDIPVSLVDIAPTFLNAAGHSGCIEHNSTRSHHLDGEDMYEISTGNSNRDTVFSHLSYRGEMASHGIHPDHQKYLNNGTDEETRAHFSTYMAVTRKWKYFYSAPDNREFLFDRRVDPNEHQNLAESPEMQAFKKTMKEKLFEHLRSGGETGGLIENDWKVFSRIEIHPDPDAGLLIQDNYTPWADMTLPEGY